MAQTRGGSRFAASVATAVAVVGASVLVLAAGPAGAVEVSDEAGLRNAFANDAQVDLLNDITLTDCEEGDLERNDGSPVVVDGHGFTITQTCPDNIMESNDPVTIQNLTLTGGRERDDGGAIDMNAGDGQTLTVIDSTLRGNCAADSAGAIENEDGDTTIIGSTLNDNFAEDQAGAFRSKRGNTLIVNSTVTQNSQAVAGAIDSGQPEDGVTASLALVYNTIVENTISGDNVCEIAVAAEPEIDEDEPGDQVATPAQVNPANVNALDDFASFGTVVALPVGGPNCDIVNPGSQGQNFSDDASCEFTGTGDRQDAGDPQVGPLADNGGPTQTRLPVASSPLVDWIAPADCGGGDTLAGFAVTDDQRDVARPQGAGCEVGSVEVEVVAPEPPAEGPVTAAPPFTG